MWSLACLIQPFCLPCPIRTAQLMKPSPSDRLPLFSRHLSLQAHQALLQSLFSEFMAAKIMLTLSPVSFSMLLFPLVLVPWSRVAFDIAVLL